MKSYSIRKELIRIIPILISGLICIVLIVLLHKKVVSDPSFKDSLTNLVSLFIAVSVLFSAAIIIYLGVSSISLKKAKSSLIDDLTLYTKKMHAFRTIIELLFRSKIWLPGLKDYIDHDFEGLTFFEVKEFYKGKSKLAIEFLQENHDYVDTENLYLELKSLLLTSPKEKGVPEDVSYPRFYNKDIVEKWLEHKCGSGLWYFFGYKYGTYKEALDLNAVFERHQDKIMSLANSIDSEAFEDSSFNEVFLSKLGEYITKEVIPNLYQYQDRSVMQLPPMVSYLYIIFLLLMMFGVLLPLSFLLFSFSILAIIFSFSIVIAVLFFFSISLYSFLRKEIDR